MAASTARVHGELLAGEVGELVGVSGTTIGQWARRGYIRASQSSDVPHVYSVEDVGEAAVVADLLARGVRRRDVRSAIDHLGAYGEWPLSEASLRVADGRTLLLEEDGQLHALTARGWQAVAIAEESEAVRLRLRHRRRG